MASLAAAPRRVASWQRAACAASSSSQACRARFFHHTNTAAPFSSSPARAFSSAPAAAALAPKLVCAGCGSALQTRDQAAAGYIPTLRKFEELARLSGEAVAAGLSSSSSAGVGVGVDGARTLAAHGTVCRRCFQAKHYGQLLPLSVPPDVYSSYLRTLRSLHAEGKGAVGCVLLVVDVWDFHGPALSATLRTLLGGPGGLLGAPASSSSSPPPSPRPSLIVAVNKVDLLPKDVSLERVEAWARAELRGAARAAAREAHASAAQQQQPATMPPRRSGWYAKRAGRDVFGDSETGGVVSVHLVSAALGWGMARLLDDVKGHYKGRDVYVVGSPNVGKSSIINALLSRQWNLPWTAAGTIRRGDRGTMLQRSAPSPMTVFLDELPPGYKVGDVFEGDAAELAAQVKARVFGVPLKAASSSTSPSSPQVPSPLSLHPGDPTPRQESVAGLYGGGSMGPEAAAAAAREAAAARATLVAEAERKARHRARKGDEGGEAASGGSSTPSYASSVTVPPTVPASVTIAMGGSGASPSGRPAPALPFTTSPLPGTTLGVIGAPLDPHGHAFLYDTPGLVGDPHKQRMLEGIAREVERTRREAAAEDEAAEEASSRGGGRSLHGHSYGRPVSSTRQRSASSALALLVPSKRPSLVTYRLRPGRVLFLGGLAQVGWDHPSPSSHLLLTVAAAPGLGVHLTNASRADELFEQAMNQDASELRGDGGWGRVGVAPAGRGDGEGGEGEGEGEGGEDEGSSSSNLPGSRRFFLWPRWGPLVRAASVPLVDLCTPVQRTVVEEVLRRDGVPLPPTRLGSSGGGGTVAAAGGEQEENFLALDAADDFEDYEGEDEEGGNAQGVQPRRGGGSAAPGGGGAGGWDSVPDLPAPAAGPVGGKRLPPGARAPGASLAGTRMRQMHRQRRALCDVVLSGLGWVALTPVEVEGQVGWGRTVGQGRVTVRSAQGVAVHTRSPLLPFEAAGTRPAQWRE
jgi:hypothetical protein